MADTDAYVTLVSSLPSSERLFVAKQPPLTRLRLDKRLAMLEPQDRQTLALVEDVLSWASYEMGDGADVATARAKVALRKIKEPTLKAIIDERMELRTVVAALRMKAAGQGAPAGAAWGFGKWIAHIARNWSDPTFRLDTSMPWLREAAKLMEQHAPQELERFLLDVTFKQLQRHAARHQFDLEAVVIYVLKWNIFDRWAQSDATAAAKRFSDLSLEALRDFPELILEGETG